MKDTTNEQWKEIPGYNGRYMVSNYGNVKSVNVWRSVHGKLMLIHREKMMHQTDNGNGYLIVDLHDDNGSRKNFYVHRAVAEAFVPKGKGKNVINHKDFNKHNNCADNLEWCTPKENTDYSRAHMSKPHNAPLPNTGEKYIRFRDGRYCVNIRQKKIYKSFETLSDAIAFRDKELIGLYEIDYAK